MKKQILLNAIDKGKCYPAFVAHFANLGPRNIFNRWYKAPGIVVIENEKDTTIPAAEASPPACRKTSRESDTLY